ncbi:MAG: RluA family pseudouridine synthase, partial [Clostridiales bacterium]|nr:RluA family pseudouridine synthase [Clostridiales bacterium]
RLQALIKEGAVTVDGRPAKPSLILTGGERVVVAFPPAQPAELAAEDINLNIVYEDADILVVDKPQGMVVHPAAGHSSGTLVNALLNHCQDLSGINGVARPGIVHRIDKDTSGLLVVAKHDAAHMGLARQWQGHNIKRLYHAVLHGVMSENAGMIDAPLARHPRERVKMAVEPLRGRQAITHYRVMQRFTAHTYAELRLETGRTHQIRVHMAHLGHPVVGDRVYGSKKNRPELAGQALHAMLLGFTHPMKDQYMEFSSPLPDYFLTLLQGLDINGKLEQDL